MMKKYLSALLVLPLVLAGCGDGLQGSTRVVIQGLSAPAEADYYMDGRKVGSRTIGVGETVSYKLEYGLTACVEIRGKTDSTAFFKHIPTAINEVFEITEKNGKYVVDAHGVIPDWYVTQKATCP